MFLEEFEKLDLGDQRLIIGQNSVLKYDAIDKELR